MENRISLSRAGNELIECGGSLPASAQEMSQAIWKDMADQGTLKRAVGPSAPDETKAEEKEPRPKAESDKEAQKDGTRTRVTDTGETVVEQWSHGKLVRSQENKKDGQILQKEYDADGKVSHSTNLNLDKTGKGTILEKFYSNGELQSVQITEMESRGISHGKVYLPDGTLARTIEGRGNHATVYLADGKTRVHTVHSNQETGQIVVADYGADGQTITKLRRVTPSRTGGPAEEVLLDPEVFDAAGNRRVKQEQGIRQYQPRSLSL